MQKIDSEAVAGTNLIIQSSYSPSAFRTDLQDECRGVGSCGLEKPENVVSRRPTCDISKGRHFKGEQRLYWEQG
mgnify:CR=1 FL=1|jgi:hypothetical protein